MGSKTMLSILILPSVVWKLYCADLACYNDEFKIGSICCPFCVKGWFVTKNCSLEDMSVSCQRCLDCADGWTAVENCTNFSDTKCKIQDMITNVPQMNSTMIAPQALDLDQIPFLVVVPMVCVLIFIAVVLLMCLRVAPGRDVTAVKKPSVNLIAAVVPDESKQFLFSP